MFANRYFATRMFARSYFPGAFDSLADPPYAVRLYGSIDTTVSLEGAATTSVTLYGSIG